MSATLLRPWGRQWQRWERPIGAGPWTLMETGELTVLRSSGNTSLALPARLVVSAPGLQDSAEAAREVALLEVEMKGLAVGARLETDVQASILDQGGGRTLAEIIIYPPDLPESLAGLRASAVASPLAIAFSEEGLHLWRELEDLVVAVVWRGHVVSWETLSWTEDAEEVVSWLWCFALQVEHELALPGPFVLFDWAAIFPQVPEGFLPARRPPGGEGPPPREEFPAPWLPPGERERLRRQEARTQTRRALALVGTALALVVGSGALYLLALHGKIRQADFALRSLEQEVAPLRQAAGRWKQMQAAADPNYFPLEMLRTVVHSIGSPGVRLTAFEMTPDKVLVEGEAANVSAATEFFKSLQADVEIAGVEWEMPAPSLQANNTARFIINGVRHDEPAP